MDTFTHALSVVPFGKIEPIRKDLAGEEIGKKYWDWTVEQVSKYM